MARADEPYFLRLGDLPGGDINSLANATDWHGWYVVGAGSRHNGWYPDEAFRWDLEDGMLGLGGFPGREPVSHAEEISCDGRVVVGRALVTQYVEAFRWTEEEGMTSLGDLPGGIQNSGATATSWDGRVVVGSGYKGGPNSNPWAFVWTAEDGMRDLGPDAEDKQHAVDVSADGRVLVGGIGEAWRWTAKDGFEMLGHMEGGTSGYGWAISADGRFVVGDGNYWDGTRYRLAIWRWCSEEGMTRISEMEDYATGPVDVSGNGSVVVARGSEGAPYSDSALIWDAQHGTRFLRRVMARAGIDLGTFVPRFAIGVSGDGRTVVGEGRDPADNTYEAWLAYLGRPERPADMDCDGSLNAADIGPFVAALTDIEKYELGWPLCNWQNADVNADGSVNGFDIEPFLGMIEP